MATDNELIAEFMGWFQDKQVNQDIYYSTNKLEFDTSWDWLMPVIHKILKIETSVFNYDAMAMAKLRAMQSIIAGLSISSDIKEVYKRVLDFVKWYNTRMNLVSRR